MCSEGVTNAVGKRMAGNETRGTVSERHKKPYPPNIVLWLVTIHLNLYNILYDKTPRHHSRRGSSSYADTVDANAINADGIGIHAVGIDHS